jgi:iron(III) transport system permease protein
MMLAAALLAAALVAAPIVSLLLTAVGGGSDALEHLAATVLPAALVETAGLLAGVALLTGAVGAGAAWLVTHFRFPGSRWFPWLLPLPLAVPTYVTALVYVELLDAAGPVRSALRASFGRNVADGWFPEVRSLSGCILLLSFVLYPYVFIACRAAFLAREPSILAAARTLGSRPLRLFLRVALPLARPAIVVGVTLALLEALNDIGATEYLGVRTLTVSAYTSWLGRGDLVGAAQIACVALALVVLLLAGEAASRGRRLYFGSPAASGRTEPVPLAGLAALAASFGCALPFLLGFAIPAWFLGQEVLRRDLLGTVSPAFLRHLGTTVALAAIATAIVVAWAAVIVLGTRFGPARTRKQLGFVASLGYAVPGSILVLGLLPPLVFADELIGAAWTAATGRPAGLVVLASGAAVVIAYAIRFMRVATATLGAQLAQTPPEIEQVARTLGARPSALAWRVQLPMLRPALGGAALLVFVDCLKELPATLLLRPLNLETLATLVYGATARGVFEDGALAALLIVAAGIGPVIWLTRAMDLAAAPKTARRVRSREAGPSPRAARRPAAPSRARAGAGLLPAPAGGAQG